MSLPFDRVVVRRKPPEGYTAVEFLALPMHDRIRCLLQHGVEFYLGNARVDRKEALASLRIATANGTASI